MKHMSTKEIPENHERGSLLGLGSSEGLGADAEQQVLDDARRYRYLKSLVQRRAEVPSGIARQYGDYNGTPERLTLHFEHDAPLHPGRIITFDEAVDVEERRAAALRVAMSQRRRSTDKIPQAASEKPRGWFRWWRR